MHNELKHAVWEANQMLYRSGLAPETWGNVSGIDRVAGVFAIKPSGVPYDELEAGQLVLLDLEGNVVEGTLRPSSDTPTHLEIYRAFPDVGGVTHTHSPAATAFAQAGRPIPCLGTTHADYFDGAVPVTRMMTRDEVVSDYEQNTGLVIAETFKNLGIDPLRMPAVLMPGHGPFTWGRDAMGSVKSGIVLEVVAEMARNTMLLSQVPDAVEPIPEYLLRKHFDRKHGPGAYYGQPGQE